MQPTSTVLQPLPQRPTYEAWCGVCFSVTEHLAGVCQCHPVTPAAKVA